MTFRSVSCLMLITAMLFVACSTSTAEASLCQTVNVSSSYPHQSTPLTQVQIATTVAGSCASDGEDYFSVRVDLLDRISGTVLSANSASIGYNATSFSVTIQNGATTPATNQTWAVVVNTYLIQAGAVSGQSLLNSTSITIQIGATPLPEFQNNTPVLTSLVFAAAIGIISKKDSRRIHDLR
ncbi:MAG TPA: hypothetical protein VLV31_13405 [Candidatus Acidoferrales bacterium]|nr:hypothetical protein [Candidatus Acidoferrales bacterium]